MNSGTATSCGTRSKARTRRAGTSCRSRSKDSGSTLVGRGPGTSWADLAGDQTKQHKKHTVKGMKEKLLAHEGHGENQVLGSRKGLSQKPSVFMYSMS